jgi:signal transduction histidine kinase
MVVHDLKNPIGIILNVNKIPGYPDKEKIIHQAGHQINNLAMNMLDVHKMEENALKPEIAEFWLNNVLNSLKVHIEQKGLVIHNKIHENYRVNADAHLVERVLANLMINAIKFSLPNQSVQIYCIEKDQNTIEIHIKDNGPGIAANKTHEIFKRYNQVEKRALGYSGSTGIGLTFCKLAIEAHHEQIGVTSELNKGADFFFTLTYKFNQNAGLKARAEKEIKAFNLSVINKKLLEPYLHEINELGIYQVSKTRKIIKQIPKTNSETKRYCEILDASILNCNDRVFENMLNLIL